MNNPPASEDRRPVGVSIIGIVMTVAGVCWLGSTAWNAYQLRQGLLSGSLPLIAKLSFAGLGMGLWLLITGLGMLVRWSLSRASFFALTAIAAVAGAGALDWLGVPEKRIMGMAMLAVVGLMCLGVWYLLGEKVKKWFR